MVAGPGDALEAGGHGHLRASDADRERVIGTLKAAFVQGRLTKDDLVVRAGLAFAAQTYAELTALTADLPTDLPAGLADAVAHGRAVQPRARRPMSIAAKAGIWITIAVGVPVVLSVATGSAQLFLLVTPFYFMALAFLGAEIVTSRQKRSDRRQLPPGAAPVLGGQEPSLLPSAGPDEPLLAVRRGQLHRPTAESPRRHLFRSAWPVRGHCAGGARAPGTAPASG
jgi:Domain of unknown function (DUF1707)